MRSDALTSERDVLLATKLHVPRPRPDLVPSPRLAERLQNPGQAAEGDAAGSGLLCPLGRDQLAEQDAHRRALVGEDPQVALRAGEDERLGQRGQRRGFVTLGG